MKRTKRKIKSPTAVLHQAGTEALAHPPPAAPPPDEAPVQNTEAPADSTPPVDTGTSADTAIPADTEALGDTTAPADAVESSPPLAAPQAVARSTYGQANPLADPRLPPTLIVLTIVVTLMLIFAVNAFYEGARLPTKSYIQRGEEAVAQQDWPAALGAIQKVPESGRERPGFLRLLADYLIGTRSSPELLANTLEKLKPSVMFRDEDRLWLCRAWLNTPHLDRARSAFEALPAGMASSLEATQLKIELLNKEGQKRQALQIQEAMEKIFTADPVVAVQHAWKEWNSPFPEVRQKAHERLWDLALRHDAAGLSAIRNLSLDTTLTRTEADQLLLLATQHPDAQAADRLKVISLQMARQPEHRQEMIQAEVTRYQSGGPAVLAQLSSWLAKEKEPGRILQLIPETRWKEQSVLLPLVVQALVDQARWQDLLNTLKEADKTHLFSKAQLMNWRAQALKKLHPEDAIKPRDELESAIRQGNVEQSYLALMTSAHIAEDWQLADLALLAYQFLAQPGSPKEADLLEKCTQMAALLKDTDALAEAAVRLAALQPNNTQAALRAAYLRLLRGEMLETAIPAAAAPAQSDTTSSSFSTPQLLPALRAWRLGDPAAARAALSPLITTRPLDLGPGERAVLAGLLAKLGETARAFQIAEKIRPELLLPEELTFLKQAL